MFCPNCGKQYFENVNFCPHCGARAVQGGVSPASGTAYPGQGGASVAGGMMYPGQGGFAPAVAVGQGGFYNPSGYVKKPNRTGKLLAIILPVVAVIAAIAILLGTTDILFWTFYPSTPEKVVKSALEVTFVDPDYKKRLNYTALSYDMTKTMSKYFMLMTCEDKDEWDEKLEDEFDTTDFDKSMELQFKETNEDSADSLYEKYGDNRRVTVSGFKKTKKYTKDEIRDLLDEYNDGIDEMISELKEEDIDPSLSKIKEQVIKELRNLKFKYSDIDEMADFKYTYKIKGSEDSFKTETKTTLVKIKGKWKISGYAG